MAASKRRHRVEFSAHKKVNQPVDVAFKTNSGERVQFPAHKPIKKEVDVNFLAHNKRK
jgi:hypothetical protein